MRHAILSLICACAACGGGGSSGPVVLERLRFCNTFRYDPPPGATPKQEFLYVPGFTMTVTDEPSGPVVTVEDDWGLVRYGAAEYDRWFDLWQLHHGVSGSGSDAVPACYPSDEDPIAWGPNSEARERFGGGQRWIDYATGQEVVVYDLDAFLAEHY